jgi:hypothetical protein
LIIRARLDACWKRGVWTAAPCANTKIDGVGNALILVVSGDDKISDRAFPPVSLDGIKRCAKPHVTVGLKKRVRELENSISIMFEGRFKRDVEQTSGSA